MKGSCLRSGSSGTSQFLSGLRSSGVPPPAPGRPDVAGRLVSTESMAALNVFGETCEPASEECRQPAPLLQPWKVGRRALLFIKHQHLFAEFSCSRK